MICPPCALAADLLASPGALLLSAGDLVMVRRHAACPRGTWCDCQHKVGAMERKTSRSAGGAAAYGA
jgi:hypothetical protein